MTEVKHGETPRMGKPLLDHNDPKANMYGVLPCPKCGSEFRWPTGPAHPTDPNTIICDDCGYKESHGGWKEPK